MAKLTVETVDTPSLLAQGLMGRDSIPQNHGMLFKFPMATEAAFWGKDTYIPLDIAFVDTGNRVVEMKQIVPMSTRLIRSSINNCAMAIETNQGWFQKNNINIGSLVTLIKNNDGEINEVSFG